MQLWDLRVALEGLGEWDEHGGSHSVGYLCGPKDTGALGGLAVTVGSSSTHGDIDAWLQRWSGWLLSMLCQGPAPNAQTAGKKPENPGCY